MTRARSPLADQIIAASPNAYESLLVSGGTPQSARQLLGGVSASDLIAGKSSADAEGMLAGLWLWLDGLEESHRISQGLSSLTGSFWHAIMHRREGDFSNSKYWYARAEGHPALAMIGQQAAALVNPLPADKRLLRIAGGEWNGAAMADLVAEVYMRPEHTMFETAVALQRLEWKGLFDYCAAG
jgi:hypothetical protein